MNHKARLRKKLEAAADPANCATAAELAAVLKEFPAICQHCHGRGFVLVWCIPICFSHSCPRCGGRGVV